MKRYVYHRKCRHVFIKLPWWKWIFMNIEVDIEKYMKFIKQEEPTHE